MDPICENERWDVISIINKHIVSLIVLNIIIRNYFGLNTVQGPRSSSLAGARFVVTSVALNMTRDHIIVFPRVLNPHRWFIGQMTSLKASQV